MLDYQLLLNVMLLDSRTVVPHLLDNVTGCAIFPIFKINNFARTRFARWQPQKSFHFEAGTDRRAFLHPCTP